MRGGGDSMHCGYKHLGLSLRNLKPFSSVFSFSASFLLHVDTTTTITTTTAMPACSHLLLSEGVKADLRLTDAERIAAALAVAQRGREKAQRFRDRSRAKDPEKFLEAGSKQVKKWSVTTTATTATTTTSPPTHPSTRVSFAQRHPRYQELERFCW